MSDEMKVPTKKSLLRTAGAAMVLAGAVLAYGLVSRAQNTQANADWTATQTKTTVSLASFIPTPPMQFLSLLGNVQPLNKAAIYARVSGYLKSWDHDIGTTVKSGQALATIDAPDIDQQLSQAKATLASVRANLNLANLTATRNNVLLQKQIVAQQLADQSDTDAKAKEAVVDANVAIVRRLEAMQSFKTLAAPFDGVVTARNVELGMLVTSGGSGPPLFEVSDLSRVRIYVQVPQSFTVGLKAGMKATFDMPQYPGVAFEATLTHLAKSINNASHSMQIELQADNADGRLFGGSYCNVHIEIPADPTRLRLPSTALIPGGKGAQVAVLGADGKVSLRSIQLGRDFGDSVEILAGLAPSDRVIDSPPETLTQGESVDVAPVQPPSFAVNALCSGHRTCLRGRNRHRLRGSAVPSARSLAPDRAGETRARA